MIDPREVLEKYREVTASMVGDQDKFDAELVEIWWALAVLAHQAGGEFRLTPVLLRGDERVVVWDDPLTGERIFRLVPNDPNRPPGATEDVEGGVQGG